MKTKIFSAVIALCFFSMIQGAATAHVGVSDILASATEQIEQVLTEEQTSQVESLKANLQILQQHYDNMFRQNVAIDSLLQQFMRWSAVVQAEGWDPGYEIIIEDIGAHPDPTERASQLRNLAALIASLRDDELSTDAQQEIQTNLDQRKQDLMEIKKSLIHTKLREGALAKMLVVGLRKKIESEFAADVKRLSSLGVVEDLRLTEPNVGGESAAGGIELAAGDLQPVVTLVYEWLKIQKRIKENEIIILEAKLTELKRKYTRFKGLELKICTVLENLRKQEKEESLMVLMEKLSGLDENLHLLIGEVRGAFDREHDRWIRLTPESSYWTLEE